MLSSTYSIPSCIFPQVWFAPSKHEPFYEDVEHAGLPLQLVILDTAGQEEYYDKLRSLELARSDVVLLCFSFDCPDSLENIPEKVRGAPSVMPWRKGSD
jgi:hypothetical protein